MARISTLSREQLPDFEPMFQILENTMGYIPNNFLSMAHWPELLTAFGGIAATILQTGEVEGGFKAAGGDGREHGEWLPLLSGSHVAFGEQSGRIKGEDRCGFRV